MMIKETPARTVTLQDVEDAVVSEHYFTAADGIYGARVMGDESEYPVALPHNLLTFCVLVLKNGFTVTGQSACADPRKYDRSIGQLVARGDATRQVWPLLGYALREELHQERALLESCAFGPANPEFNTYVGTKVVHAKPVNRKDYNWFRGWDLPADENGEDEGYLVEYTDRIENPPHVHGFQGYVSWSPKDVFERAYKLVGGSR